MPTGTFLAADDVCGVQSTPQFSKEAVWRMNIGTMFGENFASLFCACHVECAVCVCVDMCVCACACERACLWIEVCSLAAMSTVSCRVPTHTRTRITGTDTHTRTLMRTRLRMCLREEGEREGWYTYIHVRACAHMQKSSALMTLFSLVPSSAEQMFTLTDALGRQLQVIDSPLLRLGVPQQ